MTLITFTVQPGGPAITAPAQPRDLELAKASSESGRLRDLRVWSGARSRTWPHPVNATGRKLSERLDLCAKMVAVLVAA